MRPPPAGIRRPADVVHRVGRDDRSEPRTRSPHAAPEEPGPAARASVDRRRTRPPAPPEAHETKATSEARAAGPARNRSDVNRRAPGRINTTPVGSSVTRSPKQLAVAMRPRREDSRRTGSETRRNQRHPIRGEHLDMHAVPRARPTSTTSDDRTGDRRSEPPSTTDRTRLRQKRSRDPGRAPLTISARPRIRPAARPPPASCSRLVPYPPTRRQPTKVDTRRASPQCLRRATPSSSRRRTPRSRLPRQGRARQSVSMPQRAARCHSPGTQRMPLV